MSALKRLASSPPDKDLKKREEDCVICTKPATENVLECTWCEARLHAACAKLSEELCILVGNATKHIVFLCSPCLQALPIAFKYYDGFSNFDSRISNIEKLLSEEQSFDNQLDTVSKDVQQFSNQYKELSNQIHDLTSRVNQLVTFNNKLNGQIEDINTAIHKKSYAEATHQPVQESAQFVSMSQISSPVQFSAVTAVDEYVDRERRRANLVIHNLPESEATQQSDRIAYDISEFEAIVREELKIDNVKVAKAVRLGARKGSHSRLLLITMDHERSKWRILSQSTKLRASRKWKEVYICPDLTAKERELNKRLRDDLKLRRANGEKNLVIKRGQIVERRAAPSSDGSNTHN